MGDKSFIIECPGCHYAHGYGKNIAEQNPVAMCDGVNIINQPTDKSKGMQDPPARRRIQSQKLLKELQFIHEEVQVGKRLRLR